MDTDNILRQNPNFDIAKTAHQRLVALVLGFLTAVALLCAARVYLVFDFERAAMGTTTSGLWGAAETGGTVHCDGIRAGPCLEAYERAGRPPAWLWVGNSQLHGVNRYTPGEKSAPMALHDRLKPNGVYLVTESLPNATIAEFVMLIHGIGRRYDLRRVIIPVVLNGLRGGGVRESEWPMLWDSDVIARLKNSHTASYMMPIVARASANTAKPQKYFPEYVEDKLNEGVATVWPLWGERDQLRTLARYAYHVGRHKMFGVTAQTKRSLTGSGYETQMRLLGNLLDDLRAADVSALIYVPPYRQDISGPYIPQEYAQFKKELGELAKSKGAEYAILDDIVPGPEWGMVHDYLFGTDDYDFMHFTAAGHARLTDALYQRLAPSDRKARDE